MDYMKEYRKSISENDLQEILHFQYQRMMRYGGRWHMERRAILPGYVFLSGNEKMVLKKQDGDAKEKNKDEVLLNPCETPYLKLLCPEGSLVNMSKGIIKDGILIITSGPLQGREQLIRKVDRHKRTAEIEIPLEGRKQRITVGLEIYKKQI